MNTAQHIELTHLYKSMSRDELLRLVTDMVDMTREQSQAKAGSDDALKALVCFADTVCGEEALTVAHETSRVDGRSWRFISSDVVSVARKKKFRLSRDKSAEIPGQVFYNNFAFVTDAELAGLEECV